VVATVTNNKAVSLVVASAPTKNYRLFTAPS